MRFLTPTEVRAAWWAVRAGRAVRESLKTRGLDVGPVTPPPTAPARARGVVASALRRRGHSCLERALVLQAWDAMHGMARDLVVGITSVAGEFRAHAWLDGDEPSPAPGYTVLHRRPAVELARSHAHVRQAGVLDWEARRKAALESPVTDWITEERRRYRWVPGALLKWEAAVRRMLVALTLERRIDSEGKQIDLDHFHPDRTHYEPSGVRFLRRGLKHMQIRPTDVFVDFGSGKGRVVYQAAKGYRFGRVIGVEISDRLNQVARANIERNKLRLRCKNVELVTCDAAAYEIPDDVTIAYFYFPFAGDTFRAVVANIIESLDRTPRRVQLIYACPKLESVILESGRFKLVRTSRGGLFDYLPARVSVYESV